MEKKHNRNNHSMRTKKRLWPELQGQDAKKYIGHTWHSNGLQKGPFSDCRGAVR